LFNFAGIKEEDIAKCHEDRVGSLTVTNEQEALSDVGRFIRHNFDVIAKKSDLKDSGLFDKIDGFLKEKDSFQNEKAWLLMKGMLDSWPDAIYFKNRLGELILVNEAHARGMRNKFIDVIGKTDWDLFPPKEAKAMAEDDEWVMSSGKMIIDKLEYITFADGTKHYVSTTKVPRWDENGNVVGLMGITRDVTSRVNLYEMLFATYQGCIFITTKEGKWVDINEEGAKFFGYTGKKEFIDQTSVRDIYYYPGDRQKYMRIMQEHKSVKNYEIKLKKKDGTSIDVQITASARFDQNGKVQGYHGTIRDVTEEMKAQLEWKNKVSDLTKRINSMTSLILKAITNSLKVLCGGLEGETTTAINNMTGKEKEFFPLFILGKSDQEIAALTNCPEETVARHRYEIYKKG